MKRVARFVTRGTGTPEGTRGQIGTTGDTDLGIMVMFKGHGNRFKPNRVYEISECMGELIIREVGECNSQINWGRDVGTIVDELGIALAVTKDELIKIAEAGKLRELGF